MEKATYNRFITLTHKPAGQETKEQALRRMRKSWHMLQRELARKEPSRRLQFVCIVEWTKAGQPHLHVLYHGKYIAQKHLSRLWKHIHGAPIVDIRKVSADDRTAAYLTKYLTKDNRCPPRMRRWSASRGFLPALPPYINPNWPEDTKYAYSQIAPTTFGNNLYKAGWTLIEGPKDTVIALDIPVTCRNASDIIDRNNSG